MDTPIETLIKWFKAALGVLGTGVVIGAIFWAGQTYNRIEGIEKHLGNIDAAVAKIGEMQTLQIRIDQLEKRQDQIQETVRQFR